MKVMRLLPTLERQAIFNLYSLRRITTVSGCYCLSNISGDVLYIGKATVLRQRLIEHFDSDKRMVITVSGCIFYVWWRTEEVKHLNKLERGWLNTYQLYNGHLPPLNRINGPI